MPGNRSCLGVVALDVSDICECAPRAGCYSGHPLKSLVTPFNRACSRVDCVKISPAEASEEGTIGDHRWRSGAGRIPWGSYAPFLAGGRRKAVDGKDPMTR